MYQKLYDYLDGVLPSERRKSARTTRLIESTREASGQPKPRLTKPSLRSTRLERKTPQRPTPNFHAVPVWVMPAIRRLCARMCAPAAPPHIFAGVSSIVKSWETSRADGPNLPALIIAIFLLIKTRLTGVRTQPAEYAEQRSLALEVLKEIAGEDAEQGKADGADVDECTKQFRDQKWLEMDWFGNIPIGAGLNLAGGSEEAAEEEVDPNEAEEELLIPSKKFRIGGIESSAQDYLQAGLGTMVSLSHPGLGTCPHRVLDAGSCRLS